MHIVAYIIPYFIELAKLSSNTNLWAAFILDFWELCHVLMGCKFFTIRKPKFSKSTLLAVMIFHVCQKVLQFAPILSMCIKTPSWWFLSFSYVDRIINVICHATVWALVLVRVLHGICFIIFYKTVHIRETWNRNRCLLHTGQNGANSKSIARHKI